MNISPYMNGGELLEDIYKVKVDIYMIGYRILSLLEEEYEIRLNKKEEVNLIQDIKGILLDEDIEKKKGEIR